MLHIVIRDDGGQTAYAVNEEYGIDFCDGWFWWTDTDYNGHKTPVENLVRIITGASIPY